MQKIGATGDGKSAVATPDGKKPEQTKKCRFLCHKNKFRVKCLLKVNFHLILH